MSRVCRAAAALLVLLAAAAGARDADFEFADTPEAETRAPRLVYEPSACGWQQCGRGSRCAVRGGVAVCVSRHTLRRARPRPTDAARAGPRCVGCGAGGGAGAAERWVCGSDNRTYSSLCRLDLHNCVRHARVTPVCGRACPCPAPTHNEVVRGGWCSPAALRALAARLLDWFSVLRHAAPPAPRPPSASVHAFPAGCLPEVRWMFAHLDLDHDGLLDHGDLYALRHDDGERCLRPFLATCGAGAGGVTPAGWCGCMAGVGRPCARARALHKPRPGAYVPACDAEGFYKPRQCDAERGRCWCVEPSGAAAACPADEAAAGAGGAGGAGGARGEGAGVPADDEDADGGAGSGDEPY